MKLEPGDPFAVEGEPFKMWLINFLLAPRTNKLHFGLIKKKRKDGDYEIIEVIGRGVSIGLLSWYKDTNMVFYRVDCPKALRARAPDGLVEWGRSGYGYLTIARMVIDGLVVILKNMVKEGKFRRIYPNELPYRENSTPVCTCGVDIAYDSVGVNLIPYGVAPTPNAFRQAELAGRMVMIAEQSTEIGLP